MQPRGYLPIERISVVFLTSLSLHATSIVELCYEAEGAIAQLVTMLQQRGENQHTWENELIDKGKELMMTLVRLREPQLETVVEVIALLQILPGPVKMLTFTYTFKAEMASLVANNIGVHNTQ